jgi:nickel-type superoxide dismutase maturation protease
VDARPKHWPLLRAVVAEHSMEPALRPGDWLLAWRTRRVRPGQVVLAWHPERPGFLLVKRVAWPEVGGWWLASDNPAAGAADSARFGPVPREKIVAVVLVRCWPVRRRRAAVSLIMVNGPLFHVSGKRRTPPPCYGGGVLHGCAVRD